LTGEIVDKHFPDNWVIAYYMGFTADLQYAWLDYKAARAALGHTLQHEQIKAIAGRHIQALTPLHARLNDLLTEGMLTEEYVLANRAELLDDTRRCNVTLRWLMLHRTCVDAKLNKIITAQLDPEKLLFMLMHTAEFEYKLNVLLTELIDKREERWDVCRKDASGRMTELSEYFSGEKPLTRVERSDDLQRWFGNIAEKIRALDIDDSTVAGRRMQQIISALEEVEQYHQIDSSLQIKQFLAETREELTVMMRVVNVKKTVVSTLSVVADFSYAWDIINDFMIPMQDRIRLTPHTVKALRATFLKLASVLELPLLRIMEAGSDDAESVSQYYSSQLVDYIRKVLQVIPETMFELLRDIATMQTTRLRDLPAKVEKEELGEYAQFEDRYSLAKSTHRISIFTEGVLAMDATLIGVIEVQPRQLLEDGIRRELVRKISEALHHFLQFGPPDGRGGRSDMTSRLQKLQQTLDGYKRSFEYIQDYVSLHGLKIWQEEFSRIVKFNVEQECNRFLQREVDPKTSEYQDKNIPIPFLPPTTRDATTYMGRLVNELMNVTNPRTTLFLQASNAWFDMQGNELLGIRQLALLHQSVSTFGMTGLDKLLCFMLVSRIKMWLKSFRLMIVSMRDWWVALTSFAR
jgi:WASH complex subunit strumpellin